MTMDLPMETIKTVVTVLLIGIMCIVGAYTFFRLMRHIGWEV